MNKIFNLLGSLDRKEPKIKEPKSIYIMACGSDGYVFGGMKTEKEDIEKNSLILFDTYKDSTVLNIRFLNNKTKIVNRSEKTARKVSLESVSKILNGISKEDYEAEEKYMRQIFENHKNGS
jgi:hypothetical protein